MKKKNLIIFRTGSEAIKMAPLVNLFLVDLRFETRVCLIEQQSCRSQVLDFFKIVPFYHLKCLKTNQNLYSEMGAVLDSLQPILEEFKPDYVYVHGDTTAIVASSIASFYAGVKVCHIAAGLRTFDKHIPYPEEVNRQIIGRITDFHFTPTKAYKKNLLQENIQWQDITVTGSTAIDALLQSVARTETWEDAEIEALKSIRIADQQLILVTGNCSENYALEFTNICTALQKIAIKNPEVQIIYAIHLTIQIQKIAADLLGNIPNIWVLAPLDYPAFVWLLNKAYLMITDCAELQEEVPSLGIPVLVLRDVAERPEAVEAGTVLLVGTSVEKIRKETQELLDNPLAYREMSSLCNPYGEGLASQNIINFISDSQGI